ncbi:hypothetical protein Hanom_Chr16g01502401 [Helianthus anomalus]
MESFITSYRIPSKLSPRLPSPNDPATCSPERVVIYTLSFSFFAASDIRCRRVI